jgi:GTP-binding protein Era
MKTGYASLIGRPNAGKSTLLNRIIGEKVAIVSDKPQTTRNRILAVKNYEDGQVAFVDTPGIHRPLHRLNVRMVDAAVDTLREVDVVVLVFDASTRPGHGDEYVSNLLKDLKTPAVLVLNKIDLVTKTRLLPLMEQVQRWHDFAAIVPVSAATGDGVERLERVLLEQMPEGERGFPDDYLTDQPERALVAETVREKVLQHTRAELPFSTAVVVDEFDEEERERLLRLYCTIFVETESQKPIVIGRAGEMIKRIGTEARHDLEKFFGTKVFPREGQSRLAR